MAGYEIFCRANLTFCKVGLLSTNFVSHGYSISEYEGERSYNTLVYNLYDKYMIR